MTRAASPAHDDGDKTSLINLDILWFIIIGVAAGWLAGQIVKGGGFGLVGDLVVGVIGALIGGFLLGHVGVFTGLIAGAGLDPERLELLRDRVEAKDGVGVREALAGAPLPAATVAAVERLTALAGGLDVLAEAEKALAGSPAALAALAELRATVRVLEAAGLGERLAIDLGEVRGLDYYTGFVFRVFAPGLGFEVGGGGRYDTLLARFGRPLPAVGFMLGLDRVAFLLDRQGRATSAAARAKRRDGARVRFGNGEGR